MVHINALKNMSNKRSGAGVASALPTLFNKTLIRLIAFLGLTSLTYQMETIVICLTNLGRRVLEVLS